MKQNGSQRIVFSCLRSARIERKKGRGHGWNSTCGGSRVEWSPKPYVLPKVVNWKVSNWVLEHTASCDVFFNLLAGHKTPRCHCSQNFMGFWLSLQLFKGTREIVIGTNMSPQLSSFQSPPHGFPMVNVITINFACFPASGKASRSSKSWSPIRPISSCRWFKVFSFKKLGEKTTNITKNTKTKWNVPPHDPIQ